MDVQKEREAFEKWHFNKYYVETADKSTLYDFFDSKPEYVSYEIQHSWVAWQAAKASVAEGFVLVPYDVADRCMSHISIAMCHPSNSNSENKVMQMDLDMLESAIEAQEVS